MIRAFLAIAVLAVAASVGGKYYQDYLIKQRLFFWEEGRPLLDYTTISNEFWIVQMAARTAPDNALPIHERHRSAKSLVVLLPECTPCLYALGEANSGLHAHADAVEAFERVVALLPNNTRAQARLDEELVLRDEYNKKRLSHNSSPYKSIEPLPASLYASEKQLDSLNAVRQAWFNLHTLNGDLIKKALSNVNRNWAVQLGEIGGLYTLAPGSAHALATKDINTELIRVVSPSLEQMPEVVHDIMMEQYQLLLDLDSPDPPQAIEDIHELLTVTARYAGDESNTVLVPRGELRTVDLDTPVDGRVPAPGKQVVAEVTKLLQLTADYQNQHVDPETIVAWLLHRFAKIQPFEYGNERVALVLATNVMLQAGLLPVTVSTSERTTFDQAMSFADLGDLVPLVEWIREQQRATTVETIGFVAEAKGNGLRSMLEQDEWFRAADVDSRVNLAKQVHALLGNKLSDFASTHALADSKAVPLAEMDQVKMLSRALPLLDVPLIESINYQACVGLSTTEEFPDRIIFCTVQVNPPEWGVFASFGVVELNETNELFPLQDFTYLPMASSGDVALEEAAQYIAAALTVTQ